MKHELQGRGHGQAELVLVMLYDEPDSRYDPAPARGGLVHLRGRAQDLGGGFDIGPAPRAPWPPGAYRSAAEANGGAGTGRRPNRPVRRNQQNRAEAVATGRVSRCRFKQFGESALAACPGHQ